MTYARLKLAIRETDLELEAIRIARAFGVPPTSVPSSRPGNRATHGSARHEIHAHVGPWYEVTDDQRRLIYKGSDRAAAERVHRRVLAEGRRALLIGSDGY